MGTGSSVGWVVGSVRRRGLTPAALVEPVALAIHLEDVDVVGEAVEESAGKPLGAEHLGPFVEGQIGGDQGRAPLVALAEHLEQELGTGVPPIYLIRGASRTPTGPPALVMAPSSL